MTKIQKIIYWISAIVLAMGPLGTGIQQLFKVEAEGALGGRHSHGVSCNSAILYTC